MPRRMTAIAALVVAAALGCAEADLDDPGDPGEVTPWLEPSSGFLLGVDYPWHHYGHDVGQAAPWGHDGVSATGAEVGAGLAEIAASGASVVRWFVLADGRASPEFDAQGVPAGFDAFALDDLDALVAAADEHDLYLVLVLLDFGWCAAAETVDGVQLGGRADVLEDPVARRALIDDTIVPLLQRYGDEPRILAWDVINEPEWAMDDFGAGWLVDGVTGEAMTAFVDAVVARIHEHTAQLATVGSADWAWMLQHWTDRELDLLQYHDYGPPPLEWPADDERFDVPVVLGEFPTADRSLTETLDAALALGHGGAWAWSHRAGDDASALDLDELAAWAADHADELATAGAP